MATTADARAGWEIYYHSGFSLALSEINEALQSAGYAPVSDRMFRHYRKLANYGYRDYVPINRFDVHTLQDPFFGPGARSRYTPYEASIPTRLMLQVAKNLYEAFGRTVTLSEADAEVVIDDAAYVAALTANRPKRQSQAILNFLDPPSTRSAIVEKVEIRPETVALTFRFARVESVASLVGRSPLGVETFIITLHPADDDAYLGTVARSLYWLFQVVEACRAFTNEVLEAVDPDGHFVLPPATVDHLSLASPLDVVVDAARPYIVFLQYTVDRVLKSRQSLYEGDIKKAQAKVLLAEAGRIEESTRLDRERRRQLRLQNNQQAKLNEVVEALADVVIEQIHDQGGTTATHPEMQTFIAAALAKRHIEPSLHALREEGIEAIEIRPHDDPGDDE